MIGFKGSHIGPAVVLKQEKSQIVYIGVAASRMEDTLEYSLIDVRLQRQFYKWSLFKERL